jgi:hypothetical protein
MEFPRSERYKKIMEKLQLLFPEENVFEGIAGRKVFFPNNFKRFMEDEVLLHFFTENYSYTQDDIDFLRNMAILEVKLVDITEIVLEKDDLSLQVKMNFLDFVSSSLSKEDDKFTTTEAILERKPKTLRYMYEVMNVKFHIYNYNISLEEDDSFNIQYIRRIIGHELDDILENWINEIFPDSNIKPAKRLV